MSREFKPVTVAMVTWSAMGEMRTDMRFRYYRKALGQYVWESPDGTWIGDASARDVRPLVVIDPEDREQVERLMTLYCNEVRVDDCDLDDCMQAALRSLIAPPKPKEPQGLGAVVEAVCGCNSRARRYVRDPDARDFNLPWDAKNVARGDEVPWVSSCGHHRYADLTAVRVLSEGVVA